MKKIILVLSLFLLCISCLKKVEQNDNKIVDKKEVLNTSKTENLESKKTRNVEIEKLNNCDKNFDLFFEKFSRDSNFQKNRVKYPLTWKYIENIESGEITTDSITNENKYNYIDFREDSLSMQREYDKYSIQKEIIDDNNIHYKWFGFDNGIDISYKFKKINGCWYMVEIFDKSS